MVINNASMFWKHKKNLYEDIKATATRRKKECTKWSEPWIFFSGLLLLTRLFGSPYQHHMLGCLLTIIFLLFIRIHWKVHPPLAPGEGLAIKPWPFVLLFRKNIVLSSDLSKISLNFWLSLKVNPVFIL